MFLVQSLIPYSTNCGIYNYAYSFETTKKIALNYVRNPKVLEREGSLATVSYIGGEAEDAELPDETGDGGIDNQGETENERDVDGDKNPNERTELHDASTPASCSVELQLLHMKYA